jgi:hypothetical protein
VLEFNSENKILQLERSLGMHKEKGPEVEEQKKRAQQLVRDEGALNDYLKSLDKYL